MSRPDHLTERDRVIAFSAGYIVVIVLGALVAKLVGL